MGTGQPLRRWGGRSRSTIAALLASTARRCGARRRGPRPCAPRIEDRRQSAHASDSALLERLPNHRQPTAPTAGGDGGHCSSAVGRRVFCVIAYLRCLYARAWPARVSLFRTRRPTPWRTGLQHRTAVPPPHPSIPGVLTGSLDALSPPPATSSRPPAVGQDFLRWLVTASARGWPIRETGSRLQATGIGEHDAQGWDVPPDGHRQCIRL